MIKLFLKLMCIIYEFVINITIKFILGIFTIIYKFIIVLIKTIKQSFEKRKKNKKAIINSNKTTSFINTTHGKKEKFLNDDYQKIYHDIEFDFEKEAQYYNNHCCPYCGVVFEKEIKTTKNCSECKKKIIKRNNYLTKQNYLMTQDKFTIFEKYGKKLQELNFYEEILKRISYNFPNLRKEILNKRKNNLNVRDIVWGICNDLSFEYSKKGIELIKKSQTKNKQDGIFDVFEAQRKFGISNGYTLKMVEIAEYENKLDISTDLLCNYLHNEINTFLLSKWCFKFKSKP